MSKVEQRREILRTKLMAAAERHIIEEGLTNLRARTLAAEANCSIGSIYNAFEDLDEIILKVNSNTLAKFGDHVSRALEAVSKTGPKERMIALALAYLEFAKANPNAWSALFDYRMPAGVPVPHWHIQERAVLFQHIHRPLAELLPQADEETLARLVHSLFSAVHGLVFLSLQDRFSAVPPEGVGAQLEILVGAVCRGLPDELAS